MARTHLHFSMKNAPFLTLIALLLCLLSPVLAETEATQEITDRYEKLLLQSPQPGSAFDRVVEWYATQGGGLEKLQARWKEASQTEPSSRSSYRILQGLLAEHLRNPAEARAFYQEAMAENKEKASAAKLLAVLETTEGNFKAAAEAYNKALESESLAAMDRMELMRSLALLYQRSFEDDKALQVWQEVLQRFPEDPYVLEEAGEAFLAAANYEEARKAFTRLREMSARDPFRQVAASLRLARVAELENKTDEAVRIYELALEETSEGSWINREVRGRIEELFRRKDDLPGLLAYYEKRTKTVPLDYQSMAAQAAVLEELGRTDDSIKQLQAATKLAPQNLELRVTLIRSLTSHGQVTAALTEAEELAKPADAPTEVFVVLGNLYWNRYQETKDDKDRSAAIAAWQRIAPDDSKDVARIAQLAEILASHGQTDPAFAQWQRILALTPDAADARQRLAEVLQQRGDKAGALAILAGLVEEDRAKAENFVTLARIQERMKWPEEARATTAKGLEAYPTDYELLNLAWRQAAEAKDAETVAKLFPQLWANSPNEFFAEDSVKKYVSFLQSEGRDKDLAKTLSDSLEENRNDAANTTLLFRLFLAQENEEAARKTLAALKSQDKPVRAARAAYDFAQTFGSPDDQIAALEAVAVTDPRMAADSLRTVATIQTNSGKTEQALKTLTELIKRSPSDASLYTLYADVASRDGKPDEAVIKLREAIRYVEDAGTLRLQLAALLELQADNAEAARVLQEAFEKESRPGRRMDIFRRQIELAMRTGTVEALVASLKEKQAREQGGARYGTYLAEIFLMQGDFLAAREELAKSLGQTPNDPAAISRLLDLAERGGDQQEALRLAGKLAELEPSRENRASYISRLYEAGEPEQAEAEFEKVRAEILKDFTGWSSVLNAMRKAGFEAKADALIEELASASGSGVEQRAELAKLRLMQRQYTRAEEELWRILEFENLAEALAAVADDTPKTPMPMYPQFYARMQPFQQLNAEVQNSMQQLFLQNRAYPGHFMPPNFMAGPVGTSKVTPEQRQQVRALFMLAQLAAARREKAVFLERTNKLLEAQALPRSLRIIVLRCLNATEELNKLVREQAADPEADPEVDRLILSTGMVAAPEFQELQTKLMERVKKTNPAFAFEKELSTVQEGLAQVRGQSESKLDDKARQELIKKVQELLQHPGLAANPLGKLQLASLASTAGNNALAFQLMDELAEESTKSQTTQAGATLYKQQIANTRTSILASAIAANAPMAQAEFEQYLQNPAQPSTQQINMIYGGMRGMGFGRTINQLTQPSQDIVVGDSVFPVAMFRAFTQYNQPLQAERMRKWFEERATTKELNAYVLAAFYSQWFSGKREEAAKTIEAIHEKNPSQRTAALLFEIYEKLNQPAKALALIDAAGLQDSETPDIRSLRQVRLLRAVGRMDEAREIAEKLAAGRASTGVKEQLANELNLLGVPPTKYLNLTSGMMGRPRQSRDKTTQIREQLNKLITDQKADDAERMALQLLQRPLPSRQDYSEANTRMTLIRTLKTMGRLDRLQSKLEQRLEKNPSDLDAAIRLAETSIESNASEAADRLTSSIQAHPKETFNLGYALQLLQRSSDAKSNSVDILCALIRSNPDALSAGGMQLHELMSFANDPKAGAVLAETVAEMKDADYQKLFLPSRLSQQMMDSQFLSQLAEFSVQAGKIDQAISLLKRAEPEVLNMDMSLPNTLRLVELQLGQGKKEEAKKVMEKLIETTPSANSLYMGGRQALAFFFLNNIVNRGPGQQSDVILRTAKLAEQTDTLDLLLKALDSVNKQTTGVSPSLLVRTFMKRPEIAKEWRQIVLSSEPMSGPVQLPMMATIMQVLAAQDDAAKLLPALIKKIPDNVQGMHAEYTLAYLNEAIPLLSKYKKDPTVQKHIVSLVNKVMTSPNASMYLAFSESYANTLTQLLDEGFVDEAKKLFDCTASQRAGRNFGNRVTLQNLEARMEALRSGKTPFTIVCAAIPKAPDRLQVRWKAKLAITDSENDDEGSDATWDNTRLDLPKAGAPVEVEIFAGPNPAALVSVAKQSKVEGSVEVKPTTPLGLVQARWKMRDGSVKSGPLSAYVLGENLVQNNGIPSDKTSTSYQTGQPGPLGEKSAIRYQTQSAFSQAKLPIGEVILDGSAEMIIFSGWFASASRNGNMPNLEVKLTREDGKPANDGNYLRAAPSGQWRQAVKVWNIGTPSTHGSSLDKSTRSMSFLLSLNASNNMNSQWIFDADWDGLQIVKLKPEENQPDARKLLDAARNAQNKNDFSAAVDGYLAALQIDPAATLQQSPSSLVQAFVKAGRLGELFAKVSSPALFLRNPLRGNQPTLQNEALMALLAREAFADKAPPEAAIWLNQIKNASLNERTRFVVDSALFRQQVSHDPAKAEPVEVLALLGFKEGEINRERLRFLWSLDRDSSPTTGLLEMLQDEKKAEAALELLKKMQVPVEMQSAQKMLESWLLAPSNAESATELWKQSVALRYAGTNNSNVDEAADKAVVLRIAAQHPKPGNLVAAVKQWIDRRNTNVETQQRLLIEILYAVALSNAPKHSEYAKLWADAELGALKIPGYNPSRDRLRELTKRLIAANEWDRLDELIKSSKTNPTLKNDSIQREFSQLQNRAEFARGKADIAWPVTWYKPGSSAHEFTLNWQWNVKDIQPQRAKFDTAITVADKAILPAIPGQQSIELFFGETPTTMQSLGRIEGDKAEGSITKTLPSENGFLRAVAMVHGKAVSGPLTPVISGSRIYPSEGSSTKALLLSGKEPLAPSLLADAGFAPDGSPAIRIGTLGQSRILKFTGPDFQVAPGKFYVARVWIRRAGNGSASAVNEFKPVKSSSRNHLNMILSERQESTGQWVLYTRAVPSLMQHTFWIPSDEIDTVAPRFWEIDPGTEIAGWELIEVEGWKYANWIIELANLRKEFGSTSDAPKLDEATLARVISLASNEPLTAMDYHGDWLTEILIANGKTDELLALYRGAFTAETNPLFALPKIGRIYNRIITALNTSAYPPELRRQLALVALENPIGAPPAQRLRFQSEAIILAQTPEKKAEMSALVRRELAQKITDPKDGPVLLRTMLTARGHRNGQPANELINLLLELDDEGTTGMIMAELAKSPDGWELSDKILIPIALEAAKPAPQPDEKWAAQITKAIQAMPKPSNRDGSSRWPMVLGDLLIKKGLTPELVLQLRKESFARLLKYKDDPNQIGDIIRAGSQLIETSLAQEQRDLVASTVEQLVPVIEKHTGRISEDALPSLLATVSALAKSDNQPMAELLVKAAGKDIAKFPKMKEAFQPYGK